MIDLKKELANYHPIDLQSISKDGKDVPEKISGSIALYNKALDSINSGSFDMAIIGLRKAISINSKFYEAMNLLGICYSLSNESGKATEIFDKVSKAQPEIIKAVDYMNLLNSNGEKVQFKSKVVLKPLDEKNNYAKLFKNSNFRIFIGFLVGILLMMIINSFTSTNNIITVDGSVAIDNAKQVQAEYDALLEKYIALKKNEQTTFTVEDYYKSVITLYDIEKLISTKKYEEAADLLLSVKGVDFKDSAKIMFDSQYSIVMPRATNLVYTKGYNFYINKSYADSITNLKKIEGYDPTFKNMDAIYYYLARDYQELSDTKNAIKYYQKIIDKYKDSVYAGYATQRMKALVQSP